MGFFSINYTERDAFLEVTFDTKSATSCLYQVPSMLASAYNHTEKLILEQAALVGGPVSTTRAASSAIMGVGAAEGVNQVRGGCRRDRHRSQPDPRYPSALGFPLIVR